jgi:hypothetical protein
MLSVLAFKRSLSEGVLDGGSGEISLGGSRLNRFMKEVESITGNMGEGEAVTPAEEVGNSVAAAHDTEPAGEKVAAASVAPGEMAMADVPAVPSRAAAPDPWHALAQVGAQLVAALAGAGNPGAAAHPWIERDPVTGAQNLKVPLPPPEVAGQLANALSALADSLRGRAA